MLISTINSLFDGVQVENGKNPEGIREKHPIKSQSIVPILNQIQGIYGSGKFQVSKNKTWLNMKLTFGLLSIVLTLNVSHGQTFPEVSATSFQSTLSLKKNDARILEHANYIMSHPIDSTDTIRNNAMANVLLWMVCTPDYDFFIDETILPLIKNNNEEVLAIFMVSMTQFVLENPYLANNKDEIKLQAFTRLLNYYNNPVNRITTSKAMERAIYAMRVGRLRKYLRMS